MTYSLPLIDLLLRGYRWFEDELLSRLTASPAGKVTWDLAFVSKVALYAGIPLLTLFVSQFPELTDSLGRWLQSLQSQLP